MQPQNAVLTSLISAIIILLVACGMPQSENPPKDTTTILPSGTPTDLLLPTETATLAPTASPTATELPINWGAAESCVTIYPSRLDGAHVAGVVPIRPLNNTVGLEVSFLDMENDTSKSLIDGYVTIWAADVSPDRETLAFLGISRATSRWELALVDSAGKRRKVVWSSDERFYFQGWLNNRQVAIEQNSVYTVLDLHSGFQKKFPPEDFQELIPAVQPRFYVAFDPSVTRVLYKGGGNIILFDLSAGKILARVSDAYYDRAPMNAWQDAGERVATVGTIDTGKKYDLSTDEIFIVSRDGQVGQLTHLYETLDRRFGIHGLGWSPDGGKIAFWAGDGEKVYLLIADRITGALKNYCVTSVAWGNFGICLPAPIWSIDGTQLMVENCYTRADSRLLVINLEKKIAFQIAENQFPLGWMLPEK